MLSSKRHKRAYLIPRPRYRSKPSTTNTPSPSLTAPHSTLSDPAADTDVGSETRARKNLSKKGGKGKGVQIQFAKGLSAFDGDQREKLFYRSLVCHVSYAILLLISFCLSTVSCVVPCVVPCLWRREGAIVLVGPDQSVSLLHIYIYLSLFVVSLVLVALSLIL